MSRNILLKGGEMYLCEDNISTLRISEGKVLIYIVPVAEGKAGRRSFAYEASPGEFIPSFDYTDFTGKRWKLGFTAVDRASVEIISEEASEELKEEFAFKANIRSYYDEGFEEGLVEKYQLNIVTEDGFIHKTERQQKQVYEDGLKIIYNLFNKKHKAIKTDKDNKNALYDAAAYICEKEHIEIAEFSKVNESCKRHITVPDIARISHFICRKVVLQENWHKSDCGSLIVFDSETGEPYACVSKNASKYYIYDPVSKERSILTKEKADSMALEGYMLYRPFDNKVLTSKDLIKFGLSSIKPSDFLLMMIFMLVGTLIGLLIPALNQLIYDSYIPMGNKAVIIQVGCIILAFMIGNITFSIVRELASFRISSRIEYDSRGASYSRLFNLKEGFFRNFDSADLAQRVMSISYFVSSIIDIIFGVILAVVFAGVYLFCMIKYSPELSRAALLMLIIYSAVITALSLMSIKYSKKSIELGGRVSSIMFQFLNGISKIRIAGVEDRALYEYLKPYTEVCKIGMESSRLDRIISAFEDIGGCAFSLVLYYIMIHNNMNITMGAFIAFSSVFGSFSSSFMQLTGSINDVIQLKPYYNRIKPILEAVPEYSDNTDLPGDLKGEIEVSNLTFAYSKDDEPVLKNFSLHIKEGEYVGIVGSSGCGKSTLIKLLLGFETPQNGKIYYDKKDIESFDKRELRKKMGVVLQDGKLISGSIYENIIITSPNITSERVFETIREVGLEEDINNMPMGLHTIVSEDCGTISGGQQQRILIARAIASKPKILIFDEATSALDNVTQSMVCESIEKLNATRIVIAHRLSTVINCDRIIVLDKGNITESGSYEELMSKKGYFYNMASRQIA
ncbi:MAG: NHLP bacteriocin export ABC transporter permease/ATPase subunit [Clostridiales bacterium]|nr:NHLP bacteriocin export ABC transporter permease/ATPase subunit [Clostridiales bacterium]